MFCLIILMGFFMTETNETPKFLTPYNYDPSYFPGESYSDVPYEIESDGYETLDEIMRRMDSLESSPSGVYYSDDLSLEDSPTFDFSDYDDLEDSIHEAQMSKPIQEAMPSNSSPQGGGVGPNIASATTTSGEPTSDESHA